MHALEGQIDLFRGHIPRRPYHAPVTPRAGLHIAAAQQAIESRYIQYNGPTHKHWIVFDIDHEGSGLLWDDRGCPAPNIAVMNRDNGKGHYLYGLEVPVRTAADGKDHPLRYASAIEHALADKLGADLSYAGFICKNPLNNHWQTTVWEPYSYDLGTLSDFVDLSAYSDRRKRMPDYGLGRNCNLFNLLRTWAYKAIRQGWPDYGQWYAACVARAEGINIQQFSKTPAGMLPQSEVRHAARSVARWTHKNFTPAAWSALQSARGSRKGKARRDELLAQVLEMRAMGSGQQLIADTLSIPQQTVSRWLRNAGL